MLSILIPTYNQDVTLLVGMLHKQVAEQYIDFEIIVAEDGSTIYVEDNAVITGMMNCRHIVQTSNTGRSAIRNRLADAAKYDHLLFMDCDAAVCSDHFIEKYLAFCKEDCIVIGGTAYDPQENNPDFSLRLTYGRKREARHATERTKNNFATFNFLISKNIFDKVRFDESIRGYGHEDMLFGHQLHELGYEFIQIENPLIHCGLDSNHVFLQKTEEATCNLYLLYKTGRYPFLANESALLHRFTQLKRYGLAPMLSVFFKLTRSCMRWQLSSRKPSLLLYDIYKLCVMCQTSCLK